jgi:hypothetical protein
MIRSNWLTGSLLGFAILGGISRGDEKVQVDESVFGQFAGSSPCGDSVRRMLGIPESSGSDLIQWKLTLHQDPKSEAPTEYKLQCDYGATVPGSPGIGKAKATVKREGRWQIKKCTKSQTNTVVYDLAGTGALVKIDHGILHVLNADGSLMVGNGGWSYTLNRVDVAEKPGDPQAARRGPPPSYTLSPLATGATVLGVFEGRTPCRGIARELKRTEGADGIKAKWRVTLYHDPATLAPTTYKVEGTLYRSGAREGTWTILRDNKFDRNATVYHLEATKTEPALYLLKGDGNVLFFLNEKQKPLVGHADFSYTLNRRFADLEAKQRPKN